jgi:uncharacterized protein (DUF488 family)
MTENSESTPRLYTIGHSDHKLPVFLSLLSRHGITALADVRSQPYSRFNSQFDREHLCEALRIVGIKYVFLGRELGARRTEPESYEGNQARYELIRNLPVFKDGLGRIRQGLVSNRIALLCAEKDPLKCHRTILVCREMRKDPVEIVHILDDGSLESTADAETRLLRLFGFSQGHLFSDRVELIELAYDRQAESIAFSAKEPRQQEGADFEHSGVHDRLR